MKNKFKGIILGTFLAALLPTFAYGQRNVRLSDASFEQIVDELKGRFRVSTDQQLIQEMRQRLNGRPDRPDSRIAQTDFSCNGKHLVIGLVNEQGQRKSITHNIVTNQDCQHQVAVLNRNVQNRINRMTLIAYCSTTYLVKRSLLPSGDFGEGSQARFASNDQCLSAQHDFYRGRVGF